jgi:hypothetical protein
MPGRRSIVAIVSFALVALAGCAGADEPDEDDFAAQGNEVCGALAREFRELGPAPAAGTDAAAVWELRVQQLAQRAFGRLEDLEPPEDLRADHTALREAVAENREHIRRLRTVAAANARELRDGVVDGPAQREFQDLSAQLEDDQREVNARLNALGWTSCALLAQ